MTKKEERLEIVERLMRSYGIEHGDKTFISLWDLAFNISNTWNTDKFIDIKKHPGWVDMRHGRAVMKRWRLYKLFRPIRHAVKGSYIEARTSYNNNSGYLVFSE